MEREPDPVLPQIARRSMLLGAAALAGCGWQPDEDRPDAPQSAPLPRQAHVAWVFSSGGPRGFVHVGVIKALDELGLVPDLLVGSSAGALVGVLRAAGISGLELERLALDLAPARLLRLSLSGPGWLSGSALADLVREQLRERGHGTRLEQLPLMAACVARRLSDGLIAPLSRGDAGLAVQAASAIEGQFSPVRIRGELYTDADLHLPLPVRLARQLGAARVLAVDASAFEERAPAGTEHWRAGDLRKRALTAPDAADADLLLHPDLGYYAGASRAWRDRAMAIGYRATMARAQDLLALHAA